MSMDDPHECECNQGDPHYVTLYAMIDRLQADNRRLHLRNQQVVAENQRLRVRIAELLAKTQDTEGPIDLTSGDPQ